MTDRPLPAPSPPAHLPLVPAAELADRANRLADRLREEKLDGAFLLHPSSLFWISGTLGDAYPYLDASGRTVLPVRASVTRAEHESPLESAPLPRFRDLPGVLSELGADVKGAVGVELDVIPVTAFERLRRQFPDVEFRDVSRAVREARAIKSGYEIDWIERAGAIVGEAMDEFLPEHVRPGVREFELSALLEGAMRGRRHQGVIRLRRWNLEMHFGMMSTGASACYPTYFDGPDGLEALYPAVQQGGGERAVEERVPLMVDYVGAAGGYLADRTRIFCLGEPPPEAVEAHALCLEIEQSIAERLRPGAIPADIYDDVIARVGETPWADRFMGWGENRVSFLGHGVGLDLDELPVLAPRFETPLAAGHVIAVEPKIFLGGLGGVGVENTYVVTEAGGRNLTPGSAEIRIVAGARTP